MRSHIGFERLWSMKIPVPYSLFVSPAVSARLTGRVRSWPQMIR